jgi:hypothetical protein
MRSREQHVAAPWIGRWYSKISGASSHPCVVPWRWRCSLVCALACACSSHEHSPPAPSPALPPEDGFYYWLDPARCLDPCDCAPSNQISVAADARLDPSGSARLASSVQPHLLELFQAAALEGHLLTISSAYRSYAEQLDTWLATTEIGRAARPGHSEHQIGTAIDLSIPTGAAEDWLSAHAYEHGFSLSFPRGAEKLTGIRYEPWHFRFVGIEAATEIQTQGWSNVEYLRAHPELVHSGDCSDCPTPESYRACDGQSTQGNCSGDVLEFCADGAAGAVDCSSTGAACSSDPSAGAACR